MPHRRNSYVFFLLFLAGEGEGQTLSSLSLFCLSLLTLYFTLVGGAIRPIAGRPHGSTIVGFFLF
jgi:hypothetical protein